LSRFCGYQCAEEYQYQQLELNGIVIVKTCTAKDCTFKPGYMDPALSGALAGALEL
jgi:hypothetical protein